MMDWTCGWLIETWLDTPKLGKTFFQLFCFWNLCSTYYWKKKVWGQIFDENSRVFGAFYMEYVYLETRKTYWDLYFRQIFSIDVWNFCSILKRIFIGFLAQIQTLFSSMIAWCKHVPMFFVVNNQLVESHSGNSF